MSLILDGSVGVSDVDGSAATPAIRGTDANTGMFFPAADTIAFSEGGVESMRIDSSGNVGIGTGSPASRLDVSGASGFISIVRSNTDAAVGQRFFRNGTNAGEIGTGDALFVGGSGANFGFTTPSANSLLFGTNSTERMRIDSSGNIQIGQSADTFPGAGNTVTGGGITGTGRISFSAASVPVAYFNRNTDNGQLLNFRRQGNEVGSVDVTTTGITITGTNGIKFTATQTASADANTLDDYEEGTFTATVNYDGGSFTAESAVYTKIGRAVTISIAVGYNAGAGTGNTLRFISGLPFTNANVQGAFGGLLYNMNSTTTNTVSFTGFQIAPGQTYIDLYLSQWGGNEGYLRFANTGGYFRVSVTYQT
jgi:hypothetical protein